jgi:hypothetical protein
MRPDSGRSFSSARHKATQRSQITVPNPITTFPLSSSSAPQNVHRTAPLIFVVVAVIAGGQRAAFSRSSWGSLLIGAYPSPSNDLPFSGERRTDARSYHGREETRAPARGVAARPAPERAAQAFIRCNGLLDRATLFFQVHLQDPITRAPGPLPFPGRRSGVRGPVDRPPFDEPARPEPSNRCRRCDLLAAIDLPRGDHPVPRRFANPSPQIGPRRNPSAKPSSVQRSAVQR